MVALIVTEVNIYPCKGASDGPIQALARIVLNDAFVVNGIRIVKGKFGLFITFPRYYDKKKEKGMNYCFPILKSLHDSINESVLDAYHKSLEPA